MADGRAVRTDTPPRAFRPGLLSCPRNARRNRTNASPLSGDTISVATLLGRRDDELSVAVARMVAARLRHSGSDLPVIACVSLRRSETPEEDARRVANALAHLAAHHCSR